MKLKIKKVHPNARIPEYKTDGAACFDLVSLDGGSLYGGRTQDIFHTGLAFEVPPGWAMLIYSRSGHGFNNDIRLSNCVGIIDSDYRGEVLVKLALDGDEMRYFRVNAGDRIAQAMLVPVERVEFDLVEDIAETARGAGGFGSTGA